MHRRGGECGDNEHNAYIIQVWQQLCEGVQVGGVVEMMEKGEVDQFK